MIVRDDKLALRQKKPVSQTYTIIGTAAEAAGFAISQSTDHGGIGQRDTASPHRNAFPLLYEALPKEKARRPDAFASESTVLFVSNVISDCFSRRFADSAAKTPAACPTDGASYPRRTVNCALLHLLPTFLRQDVCVIGSYLIEEQNGSLAVRMMKYESQFFLNPL